MANSRRIIVSLGDQIAFFFIFLRSLAISHSVKRIHGACSLPGFASTGGATSNARALLVEIPATALWTLVPITPGGLGGRAAFGSFGAFSLIVFDDFGILGFSSPSERLLKESPMRDVATGTGEGGPKSHSASESTGERASGGGRTSPGTVMFCDLCRLWALDGTFLPVVLIVRAPSRRSAVRGSWGGPVNFLDRVISGDCSEGIGVGSREGGLGKAFSLVMMLVSLL